MTIGLGALTVLARRCAGGALEGAGEQPNPVLPLSVFKIEGLAGALITASFQLGVALGLVVLSALATARTNSLVATHHALPDALVGGYARALLGAVFFVAP